MGLKTFGLMGVDWEELVNLERLRRERLGRIKAALKKSEMGSLLCFDMNNIRYITATHIGTWAMDKLVRFSLLPQDDEPIMWTSARRRAIIRSIAPGLASAPVQVSLRYVARPIPVPVWLTTWQRKSSSSWKNASCTTSRWAST